jgi:quercetin dioxygenase-like cupin family protein
MTPEADDIRIPLPSPFLDERGCLQNLLDTPINSVIYVTSTPGSIRANHYHQDDWHYAYLVSGEMIYYHRAVGATEQPEEVRVKPGDMIFTPPMVEHAMKFLVDSTFIAFGGRPRDQESYEADLVRVTLINE